MTRHDVASHLEEVCCNGVSPLNRLVRHVDGTNIGRNIMNCPPYILCFQIRWMKMTSTNTKLGLKNPKKDKLIRHLFFVAHYLAVGGTIRGSCVSWWCSSTKLWCLRALADRGRSLEGPGKNIFLSHSQWVSVIPGLLRPCVICPLILVMLRQ